VPRIGIGIERRGREEGRRGEVMNQAKDNYNDMIMVWYGMYPENLREGRNGIQATQDKIRQEKERRCGRWCWY
jgi:hypothetical protein